MVSHAMARIMACERVMATVIPKRGCRFGVAKPVNSIMFNPVYHLVAFSDFCGLVRCSITYSMFPSCSLDCCTSLDGRKRRILVSSGDDRLR
jgi:hypothetical protein